MEECETFQHLITSIRYLGTSLRWKLIIAEILILRDFESEQKHSKRIRTETLNQLNLRDESSL